MSFSNSAVDENICGLEKLQREFGARRLRYGSFFPRYAMGAMLFALHLLVDIGR